MLKFNLTNEILSKQEKKTSHNSRRADETKVENEKCLIATRHLGKILSVFDIFRIYVRSVSDEKLREIWKSCNLDIQIFNIQRRTTILRPKN